MSVFRDIVKELAHGEPVLGQDRRDERRAVRKIRPEGISPRNIMVFVGPAINCYPGGYPIGKCYEDAVFISLSGKLKGRWRGHLSFDDALKEIIRHCGGRCPTETKRIGLITDSWDAKSFDYWRQNLSRFKRSGISIESYLIDPGIVSKIDCPWNCF